MANTFYKYHGTGNDFVLIDNREGFFNKKDSKQISFLCKRHVGIGADGLILLENHDEVDFKMVYFNADGNESSMCGNGGRCITSFAKYLKIIDNKATFEAIDGMHEAIIDEENIKLHMQNVERVEKHSDHVFLDTGSPHHVQLENNLDKLDIKNVGSKIRYGSLYNEAGSNVNFVSKLSDHKFTVRTYERGVENETLSCGTGVTAVALAMHYIGETEKTHIHLETPGGDLQVSFLKKGDGYKDIWLIGPAVQVFKGILA